MHFGASINFNKLNRLRKARKSMGFVLKELNQSELKHLSRRVRGPCVQLQDVCAMDEQARIALISLGRNSYAREDFPIDYLNLLRGDKRERCRGPNTMPK